MTVRPETVADTSNRIASIRPAGLAAASAARSAPRLAGSRLPAGAPAELVTKLHDAVARAVADPEVRQQFDTLGLEGVAMAPGPFATFVASEARAAQEIARRLGPGARQ